MQILFLYFIKYLYNTLSVLTPVHSNPEREKNKKSLIMEPDCFIYMQKNGVMLKHVKNN